MSLIIGKPTYIELGGVDITDSVTDVNLGMTGWLDSLPRGELSLEGCVWDTGLTEAAFTFEARFCHLTPESRCWLLKMTNPWRYARLRRMRYETRRRKRR